MLWLALYLSMFYSSSGRVVSKAARVRNFENSIVFEHKEAVINNTSSVISCHLHCTETPRCKSFFFNSDSRFCQLHGKVFRTEAKWKISPGTRYYQITTVRCPTWLGYIFVSELYFCYKLYDSFLASWSKAIETCENDEGHLIILDTIEKYNHIVSFIQSQQGLSRNDFTVGATDKEKEGAWRWVNGEELSGDDPIWADNEPDNMGFPDQDFAILSSLYNQRLDDAGRWDRYFFCEINVSYN